MDIPEPPQKRRRIDYLHSPKNDSRSQAELPWSPMRYASDSSQTTPGTRPSYKNRDELLELATTPNCCVTLDRHSEDPGVSTREGEANKAPLDDLQSEADARYNAFRISDCSLKIECSADTVCFGMFSLKAYPASHNPNTGNIQPCTAVTLDGKMIVSKCSLSLVLGRVEQSSAEELSQLQGQRRLSLQHHCSPNAVSRHCKHTKDHSLDFCTIIYGPVSLSEDVGKFLEACHVFLQDPVSCDRNVRYLNPHYLEDHEEEPLWTQHISRDPYGIEEFSSTTDLLADLTSGHELPEADTPSALQTKLLSHQRQALTFMQSRERGWALRSPATDIWKMQPPYRATNGFVLEEKHPYGGPAYMNTVTSETEFSAPPEFRGGILADDMGLGKTLTAIALVASDRDTVSGDMPMWNTAAFELKSTLIVVRAPLLNTWESQLKQHVRQHGLEWKRHHGKTRVKSVADLASVDIVLTTYHTLASEWRRHSASSPMAMFTSEWFRVILDEAHDIREGSQITAKAVCALQATRRWAISGTPIQNRTEDLASLYHFLRAYPYDEPGVFRDHIRRLGKLERDEAMRRLRNLVCSVMLRRSIGTTITLPRRRDLLQRLDFSPEEKTLYAQIEKGTMRAQSGTQTQQSNALVCINNLRQVCNMGLLAQIKKPLSEHTAWTQKTAQDSFNGLMAMGSATCNVCNTNLESVGTEAANQTFKSGQHRLYSCLFLICGRCCGDPDVSCAHDTKHTSAVITTLHSPRTATGTPERVDGTKLPTKIRCLLQDLEIHTPTEKCVVFSFWTTTLDLVEEGLRDQAIEFVRFDGNVTDARRVKVLENFREDQKVRVALLTISCGAVGLDLTTASRAYLMEPHWNPSVEEQALARIHRIGQQRPITTIRYVMRGSYEEHILKIQQNKQLLSELFLSPCDAMTGLKRNADRFEQLRRVLGQT